MPLGVNGGQHRALMAERAGKDGTDLVADAFQAGRVISHSGETSLRAPWLVPAGLMASLG